MNPNAPTTCQSAWYDTQRQCTVPFQRGSATLRVEVSPSALRGAQNDVLIHMEGAQKRVFLWRVTVVEYLESHPRHVNVVERDHFVHHWYDHFYRANSREAGSPGDQEIASR